MAFCAGVSQITSPGGLSTVVLEHGSGASASIALFGATVTSYKAMKGAREVLFLSDQSILDGSKAIRGGVPLVFPQFGQPKKEMPSHGFARINTWSLGETSNTDGRVKASFQLRDSESTRLLWPFSFLLTYTVSLGEADLTTSLEITNPGPSSFEYSALLHTYYRVQAINKVAVRGLKGLRFLNQLKAAEGLKEDTEDLKIFDKETDDIYHTALEASDVELLEDGAPTVRLTLRATHKSKGSSTPVPPDCVVWNPWVAKSKSLADFGDEEYNYMVCLEPGLVSKFHGLGPGESLVLEQVIRPL